MSKKLADYLNPGALERIQNFVKGAERSHLPAAYAVGVALEVMQVVEKQNEDLQSRIAALEAQLSNLENQTDE